MRPIGRGFPRGSRERLGRLAVAGAAAIAALAAPAHSTDAAEPTEAAQSEIRRAIENWQSAFNGRNEQQVCDLFAADIVANYQGEPARDYTSLCEMLRTALRDLDTTYRYSVRIDEITLYGGTAVVRLVWALEIDRVGKPKEIIKEPAVDIFRRQADGSWRISRYLAYPASR